MIFFLVILAIIIGSSFFTPAYAIQGAIRMATPLLLAGIGGLFSQIAGVLNIALEGMMVFSAFFSIIGTLWTGSFFLGTLIGITASLLLACLFAGISLGLDANIFFTGLATNIFATGFTILLQTLIFNEKGAISLTGMKRMGIIHLPVIRSIPVIGNIFSGYNVFIYISWLLALLAFIIIYKTPAGLRIRSVGENPGAFKSIGLNPKKYQFAAILVSGLTCGIAGAGLSLPIMTFAQNMVNNRGWIGLVTIFLGGQHPAGIVAASIIFGGTEQLSYIMQISSFKIPHHFVKILPYIVTVFAMTIHGIWAKSKRGILKK